MSNMLLIIDPQNDFTSPRGSLFIPGADIDSLQLASFIKSNSSKIDSIHITLDSHPTYHIAHPLFWKDTEGKNPAPYTIITYQDFSSRLYMPVDPTLNRVVEEYLLALENRGRYNLTIWSPHCLPATWGACVEDNILNAVHQWEANNLGKNIDFIRKSENPLTEHYSAIQAEVPDPEDPFTRTNFTLIDTLKEADRIIIAGEALSHCVANTLRDLSVYIPAYRMTVLTDCTSNVLGFENDGNTFMKEYKSKGMQFVESKNITW